MDVKLVTAVGFAGLSAAALACCISFGDIAMELTEETALIIWDEEKKVEHFIRRASFEGKAPDFGFILPVPTKPTEIEVANDELFGWLESQKPRPRSIGCSAPMDGVAGSLDVEVLEEKKVGDYDVTVLKATDGSSLKEWLAKRKHKMREAMVPWFDHYAKKDWVFVAFKYSGKKGPTPTRAVRVSFQTDQPHYPYKMPTDTWEPGHFRPLDLFVISQKELEGNFTNGRSWQAVREWTTDLKSVGPMLDYLPSPEKKLELPSKLVLTRFKNTEAANDYSMDLVFQPKSAPIATYAGAGGAVAVILLIARRRRKSAQPLDASLD